MLIKNLFRYWTYQVFAPGAVLREKYEAFKTLLGHDKNAHEHMALLEDIFYNQTKYDLQAVVKTYTLFSHAVSGMVEELLKMCPASYWSLKDYYTKFNFYTQFILAPPAFEFSPPFTIEFSRASLLNSSIAGKKAFTLSQLNRRLHLPTPDGFVVTTNAFHYFYEANNLRHSINEKLAILDISDTTTLDRISLEIQTLILKAIIPEDVHSAITDAMQFRQQDRNDYFRVALRSSAVKEDGKASFAGQYETLLNIEKKDIITGYKQIIASKYSSQALFYRISHGISDDETPMAVLVLEMVDSASSGVMYTRSNDDPLSENLTIHSVWGQGELLVNGEISPDTITVSKKEPAAIIDTKTGAKRQQMILAKTDKTRTISTDQQRQNQVSLDESSILTLTRWGVLVEKHFGYPQDIEWCRDTSDKLFILQSRPLSHLKKKDRTPSEQIPEIKARVLCSQGETVSSGIGTGPVYKLEQASDIHRVPKGSVLVVRFAHPRFVTAIDKMAAIIIETGSTASHFATVAREYKIPAITDVKNGFHLFDQGNQITVDADKTKIYQGDVPSLRSADVPAKNPFEDSPFMSKLRYVINFCTKLKLTDPSDRSFTPEACRSLHDIIRFAHETAVQEMFLTGNRKGSRKKGAKKLISHIPMLFYVLDVGQGFKAAGKNKRIIRPEDIASEPMNAILKGLSHPGISWDETSHFDWEEYDKIVMAGGIISADSPRFASYAVISEDYANINFRFGYHFAIIDAICSPCKENNYILFRFSGGGGSPSGRLLRARFLKEILERNGFLVDIKSDLIDAEFKNGSLSVMKETLDITGRLLGATKLMDMYLKESSEIETRIDDFMNGCYDFRSVTDEKHYKSSQNNIPRSRDL